MMTTMTTADVTERHVRRIVPFGVAGTVVVADLTTKQVAVYRWTDEPVTLVGGWLTLTESRNPGAAFGVATSATPVLSVLAALAAVALAVLCCRAQRGVSGAILGLLLGGVTGNLVDRLFRPPGPFRGHVVDWIDIGSWPNFNLADSALVSASILLVLWSLKAGPDEPLRSDVR